MSFNRNSLEEIFYPSDNPHNDFFDEITDQELDMLDDDAAIYSNASTEEANGDCLSGIYDSDFFDED